MLVPMSRVEIIGPKSRFFEVVSTLHEQGTLHIEDLSKKIGLGEIPLDQMEVVSSQANERERMEDLLIRVRAIIKALHLPGTQVDEAKRQKEYLRLWKLDSSELSGEIARVIDEVEDKTSGLAQSQTELESELSLLARYEPILHKIQPLAKQIVTTGAFDSVALLVERRYKGALEQLKEELDKLTHKQCEIVSTDVDEDTTAAIVVFNRSYAEPVHKFLAMENVNQIRLPSDMQGMPFDEAYSTIKDRRKNLPGQLDDVRKELESMSSKWYLRLATIRDVLSDKIEEIQAIPKFGQTEYAFVITGWLPAENMSELRKTIKANFGDDVIVNQLEIDEHEFEDTPVALKNAKAIAPFAPLMSYVNQGLPKYGTIDPTWMVFLFYPLFFGMIVGDIGYGAIMLALVIFLRVKYKDKPFIQMSTSILGPACTAVIAFGFLYGEFFGNVFGTGMLDLIKQTPPILGVSLPFNRIEFVDQLMYVVLAIGFLQVMFGLILGIINGVRTKHMKHVYEKSGMLTVLVTMPLLIVVAVIPQIKALGNWAYAIQAVVALAMFIGFFYAAKGGPMGVVESVLQFSNVASYIRIMAVGLAGAIFAEAVNVMVKQMVTQGALIMGVILALILHSLNLIISAFTPNIHALRLNFLEFFGKFYEAGKNEYKPFQKTGGEKSA
ncbi:MAG TPA: V-type ATP synthase subunit I [Coriobacteriia bacterium]